MSFWKRKKKAAEDLYGGLVKRPTPRERWDNPIDVGLRYDMHQVWPPVVPDESEQDLDTATDSGCE